MSGRKIAITVGHLVDGKTSSTNPLEQETGFCILSPVASFFDLFALDMQRLVNDEIIGAVDTLIPSALTGDALAALRAYERANAHATKCLYILHYQGEAVYVGKAESAPSLRLSEHLEKLSSRLRIDVGEISFRCLYLDENWSALTHERKLIGALGCSWNNAGFGNHDPGKQRDTTRLKASHFDRRFPINPAVTAKLPPGAYNVAALLPVLRRKLPYLFRYATTQDAEAAYLTANVTLVTDETTESVIAKVVDSLGPTWQATFLFGYLILYPEIRDFPAESFFRFRRGEGVWVASPLAGTEP